MPRSTFKPTDPGLASATPPRPEVIDARIDRLLGFVTECGPPLVADQGESYQLTSEVFSQAVEAARDAALVDAFLTIAAYAKAIRRDIGGG